LPDDCPNSNLFFFLAESLATACCLFLDHCALLDYEDREPCELKMMLRKPSVFSGYFILLVTWLQPQPLQPGLPSPTPKADPIPAPGLVLLYQCAHPDGAG
jgi:hypothetical protein